MLPLHLLTFLGSPDVCSETFAVYSTLLASAMTTEVMMTGGGDDAMMTTSDDVAELARLMSLTGNVSVRAILAKAMGELNGEPKVSEAPRRPRLTRVVKQHADAHACMRSSSCSARSHLRFQKHLLAEDSLTQPDPKTAHG
jgi:hypothetical protein